MVECTALEMRHRCKPIGGSNPSLSAIRSRRAKTPVKQGAPRATGFVGGEPRWRTADHVNFVLICHHCAAGGSAFYGFLVASIR